jgi:drug/metabolite transporter (DMT)-like permease
VQVAASSLVLEVGALTRALPGSRCSISRDGTAPPYMKSSAHSRALVQLTLAALCWSLGGVLIKRVDWPPLAVAGGRGLIAAVFLTATSRGLRFTWSPVQIGAAMAYAATTVLFVLANKLTTAANAILLQYTAPVWIALFGAWWLGERTTRSDWLTIGVVLGGMMLFFADGLQLGGLAGNAFALASGVSFALMILTLSKQKKSGPPLESIILGNGIAFAIGLPFMVSAPLPSAGGLTALAILGVVQLGVSYWLYARALRHVTAIEAVLLPVVEPILNPVWAVLALGEKPTTLALAGGALVLGAVTFRAIGSVRASRLRTSMAPT